MVKILTDSSCDIDLERAEKMGIEIVPIEVHFGEESYRAGIDLSTQEFYEKLKTVDKLPTTTQITPVTFEEIFRKHIDNGDEIVGMFISAEMSGTYQNALLAKNMIGSDKIHIVNTLQTTFGLGLLLSEACAMRDRGMDGKTIYEKVTELVPRVKLLASVETLKYLKMGGRLSAATAMVGGILGIYPVITIENGKVITVGKARGRAAASRVIESQIKDIGISSDYGVTFGHSACPDVCAAFEKQFSEYVGKRQVMSSEIGCIVGTHVGPGAVGIAFIKK